MKFQGRHILPECEVITMDQKKTEEKARETSSWTPKRIAALAGVVLLAGMYVVSLIAALFDFPGSYTLFRVSFAMTLAVPIFLFIFIWAIGRMTGKRIVSDPEKSSSQDREKKD